MECPMRHVFTVSLLTLRDEEFTQYVNRVRQKDTLRGSQHAIIVAVGCAR